MADSRFVYVTYIRTTPEKLWQALTDLEFTRRYWVETWQECEWKEGAAWRIVAPNGAVPDSGEVIEIDPPKKLVLSWKHHLTPAAHEASTRLTYELEPQGEMVKFTVTHASDVPDSKVIGATSQGWPVILSSLKSLLETGESLEATRTWPHGL
jgi:uncharacterized protein YndB with AHSA1/START domain